jgi:hypothetical protein
LSRARVDGHNDAAVENKRKSRGAVCEFKLLGMLVGLEKGLWLQREKKKKKKKNHCHDKKSNVTKQRCVLFFSFVNCAYICVGQQKLRLQLLLQHGAAGAILVAARIVKKIKHF